MSHLVQPRRFGEVFQIDENLYGTIAQQQAIRDALTPAFGTKFAALLHSFDVYFNRAYMRSYVTIEIKPMPDHPALAGASSIAVSDKVYVSSMKDLIRHEFGHILDNTNYISQADRDWFVAQTGGEWDKERWATAVMEWINGSAWESLDAILLKPIPLPPSPPVTWPVQVAPSEWGAKIAYDTKFWRPWNPDKLVIHYEGSSGVGNSTIAAEMSKLRAHEEYHLSKGWLGLAYNYAIGNSGTLYRVRGENRSGATSGDEEPDGIPENYEARAYLFLIGGLQQPSAAAKHTFHREWVRWGQPRVTVHSDSTSTACPGDALRTWVKSGGYRSNG